jgi:hypothetical protein
MHGSTPQAPVINVISVRPESCHILSVSRQRHVSAMPPTPQALSKVWSCHAPQLCFPESFFVFPAASATFRPLLRPSGPFSLFLC